MAKKAAEGISQSELARLLGVTPAAVTKAVREGRIPRKAWKQVGGRRRIVDVESAAAAFHQNKARNGRPPDESNAAERYQRERAAKLAADRELAELKLAERSGDLIAVAEVAAVVASAMASLRRRLLAFPDRLAAELAAETDARQCRERLRQEIRMALDATAGAIEAGADLELEG